jgi:hypothetical protein
MAERNAVGEDVAFELDALSALQVGLRHVERRERGAQQFRKHHGRGLQRLDFLVGIDARDRVLHGQDADGPAGAQDRDAEEGLVDFFARLRPVCEGMMALRVGQVDRLAAARDQADEALAGFQMGVANGFLAQAFGGEQLHRAVLQAHIDGAYLRDHSGGDQAHDPVQPRRDFFGLGLLDAGASHHLPQLPEKYPRCARCPGHAPGSSRACCLQADHIVKRSVKSHSCGRG